MSLRDRQRDRQRDRAESWDPLDLKKEDYIFGFKKTVKSKFEALENDCSDSSRCLLEHIGETTDKWTSYSTKKYNTNVEKDIDGMIRDIKTAMEVKMIESGQKLNIWKVSDDNMKMAKNWQKL